MHRGHDHDHHFNGSGIAGNAGAHALSCPGPGHNRLGAVAQWQTPHLDEPAHGQQPGSGHEPDLDQVEAAFVEGFATATDPTSFLRLANVPFEATAVDGATLVLLRVETDAVVDVGSITPHLGGASFRYDPLPASLTARRRRLRFVYFDGTALRTLTFAEARVLDRRMG